MTDAAIAAVAAAVVAAEDAVAVAVVIGVAVAAVVVGPGQFPLESSAPATRSGHLALIRTRQIHEMGQELGRSGDTSTSTHIVRKDLLAPL